MDAFFETGTHESCLTCVIIAGTCSKSGSISGVRSRSSYVLVNINNMKIEKDLVAYGRSVGGTIESFDLIKLACESSVRCSYARGIRGSGRACNIGRRHSDAVES